jgi:hypothetical protein
LPEILGESGLVSLAGAAAGLVIGLDALTDGDGKIRVF